MKQCVESEEPEIVEDGSAPDKGQNAQRVVAGDSRGHQCVLEQQTHAENWPAREQEVAEGTKLQANIVGSFESTFEVLVFVWPSENRESIADRRMCTITLKHPC